MASSSESAELPSPMVRWADGRAEELAKHAVAVELDAFQEGLVARRRGAEGREVRRAAVVDDALDLARKLRVTAVPLEAVGEGRHENAMTAGR